MLAGSDKALRNVLGGVISRIISSSDPWQLTFHYIKIVNSALMATRSQHWPRSVTEWRGGGSNAHNNAPARTCFA